MNLISTGKAGCFGVVFEPTRIKKHGGLLAQVLDHKLDAILDPGAQQSALAGSYTGELGSLPWGVGHQHQLTDFISPSADKKLAALAEIRPEVSFSQKYSPPPICWICRRSLATNRPAVDAGLAEPPRCSRWEERANYLFSGHSVLNAAGQRTEEQNNRGSLSRSD